MTRTTPGDLLAQTLKSQGRKQRWLAAQVGVSEHLISKVIHGERALTPEVAARIAPVLGIPLFLLIDFHGQNDSIRTVEFEPMEAEVA